MSGGDRRARRAASERPAAETGSGEPASAAPGDARARFLALDPYRVRREWARYEGTAQRDLFRQLRVRFLLRYPGRTGGRLEVGPGPGRFTPFLGGTGGPKVLLDLSDRMLASAARRLPAGSEPPALFRGDGSKPPFRPGEFAVVVLFGNSLGFAGDRGPSLLASAAELVRPEGLLLLETVAGSGEHSAYLARLPPGAVRRLIHAPVTGVLPRIQREGFIPEPDRSPERHGFRRWSETDLRPALEPAGFTLVESLSVAPLLGSFPGPLETVRRDPVAWSRLLELEEAVGRTVPRRRRASALLSAWARFPTGPG